MDPCPGRDVAGGFNEEEAPVQREGKATEKGI